MIPQGLIRQMVPRYILADKNGLAMAKALEVLFRHMHDVPARGLQVLLDVEAMPEWRLDELAWEYDLIYDYAASEEEKRRWIRQAMPDQRIFGTPEIVRQLVAGLYGECEVEEWWEYGGEPYHFRVNVVGDWTEERRVRAMGYIERAKNLRSAMDRLALLQRGGIDIGVAALICKLLHKRCGQEGFASGADPFFY